MNGGRFRYQSGQEIMKGDRVMYHGESGEIEFVADALGDAETDWYVHEFGGGIMIANAAFGHVFLDADDIHEEEDLEFVSRAEAR